MATFVTLGAISLSSSTHLPLIGASILIKPVALRPGRDRPATNPSPTGSPTLKKTMGIVEVCCSSAAVVGVLCPSIKSGCSAVVSSSRSFDHLVGAREQRRRDGEAECLSRGQIDNEIEFGRLLDRKIARLCTTKNFIDILASTPEQVRKIRCIRHQTSRFDEFPKTVHCRQSCGYRQSIDPNAIGVHEGVAHDVKRIRARLDRLEGRVNIVRSSNLERGEFESERASG